MKRIVYVIIDQLAGHWEESVKIEGTDLPPANVKGYHEAGLIPTFSRLIDAGLWVKRPWNRGKCKTTAALKYLCTGSYGREEAEWAVQGGWFLEAEKEMGLLEFAKRHYPDELRVITTGNPFSRGYFYVPEIMQRIPRAYDALPPSHSDEAVVKQLVFPWMEAFVGDRNLTHIYLSGMDRVTHCPSYPVGPCSRDCSKHTYMLFLDKLLGDIVEFLEVRGWWEDTCMVIASDHGYHLGCSVAASMGVKTNNWCCDHPEPWDCEVWDFEHNRSTGIYSGGSRRVTFIVSGGGVERRHRGKTVEEADIRDVVPTLASLLDVPFECEGTSIL